MALACLDSAMSEICADRGSTMDRRKFRTAHKFRGKRRRSSNKRKISDAEHRDAVVSDAVSSSGLRRAANTGNTGEDANCSKCDCSTCRKLDKYEEKTHNIDSEYCTGNLIVEFQFLKDLVSSFSCSSCHGNRLSLQETKRNGLVSTLNVLCNDCLNEKEFSTAHRMPSSKPACIGSYEINRLATAAFREVGCGQAASQSWFAAMNMPISLSKRTFASHSKALSTAATETADDVLTEAAKIIRQAYADIEPSFSESPVIDISVAFDGTWHRRGHRSHYGVGVVTDLLTGLVVDYEIMSTYCFGCQAHQKDDKSSSKYKEWLNNHREHCNKNFCGSANAMESAAAVLIWNRSIEKYGFRYTVLLGDGDSKTYLDLLKAKPYGETVITKEECINHISKRMGTALKNLVVQCRAEGTPISGKGRLTQERILKLQNYYGKAIKDNTGNLEAMRNAVWAVLFHSVSNDDEPHHNRCPSGETSWCWWQRWQATGIHPARGHHSPLPKDVGEKMVPIFRRLGGDELLKRCLQGKSQNANECINSLIWQRCPKVRFTGLSTIKYAVSKGISVYNKGASSSLDVAEKMGVAVSQHAVTAAQRRDAERRKKSEVQSSEAMKNARKVRKLQKTRLYDEHQEKEGTTYAPGSF